MGIMIRFKTFLSEGTGVFNPLKHTDLRKDPSRIAMFLKKIKDKEKFATVSHGEVVIDPKEYDEMLIGMKTSGFSKMVKAKVGGKTINLKYPCVFLKTGEFGGKGKGSGVAAENAALTIATANLNAALKAEKAPSIRLKIGKRTVDCAGIISTPNPGGRDPKSDFTVVDGSGKAVAHISHKAGKSAKDFQQYGGVTDLKNDKEITAFMNTLIKLRPEGLKSGETFYRKIKSKDLIMKSIYGVNAGISKVDVNNVDEFHQGEMKFVKKGRVYEIQSVHKGIVGDIPTTGGYEPVLLARYNRRRGTYGNLVLDMSRIGIFPMAKISSTSKEV